MLWDGFVIRLMLLCVALGIYRVMDLIFYSSIGIEGSDTNTAFL